MKKQLELFIEQENLEGIIRDIQRNRRYIDRAKEYEESEPTGQWEQKHYDILQFILDAYEFRIIETAEQYYDTSEDDGTTAGWTTTNRQRNLIIKHKDTGCDKLNLSGSKYIKDIENVYYKEKSYRQKLLKQIILDITEISENVETTEQIICYKITGKHNVTISQIDDNIQDSKLLYKICVKTKNGKVIRSYNEEEGYQLEDFFAIIESKYE